MTKRTNAVAKPLEPDATADAGEAADGQNRHVGGSQFDVWNDAIVEQVWGTLPAKHSETQRQEQEAAAYVGLVGIGPQNELEAMIAAQLLAAHHATLECYRRAAIPDQVFMARREYLNQAGKLSRTFATLLEALNRHRGNGHEQKVTVQHVHIHDGGQAIVGAVEAPGEGGILSKIVEQPHAQLTHAPVTPLRSPNEEGEQSPAMPNGRCRMHGGLSTGAPKGNQNALRHGRYSAEAIARRREIRALLKAIRESTGKALDHVDARQDKALRRGDDGSPRLAGRWRCGVAGYLERLDRKTFDGKASPLRR